MIERAEAARRRHHDRALGVHLRRRSACRQAVDKDLAPIEFLAQNVKTADFDDPVFKPYVLRELNGVPVAVIGQAFPYTPIANPRHIVADWTFGIQEPQLQKLVDEVRAKGARVVVLLSHNGMDVDLKLAARVRGIDAILGGHTHDGVPVPVIVPMPAADPRHATRARTASSSRVLDLDVKGGSVAGLPLPAAAGVLEPAAGGPRRWPGPTSSACARPTWRSWHEPLAVTEGLLYRRGNFNGTFDQLILDALMAVKGAEIAFSPGLPLGHHAAARRRRSLPST